MVEQPEYKRENYEYSIDSWPKAMQEAFLNQDNHRSESQGTGSKPAPETLEFADKPDATVLHLANFIDAVRTRQPSYETAEVEHHAAAAGHMVNLSYRSGKRMVWDANKGNAAHTAMARSYGATIIEHCKVTTINPFDDGVEAEIIVVEPTGSETQVFAKLGGEQVVAVFRERHQFNPGDKIRLKPDPALVHLYDGATGKRLNA